MPNINQISKDSDQKVLKKIEKLLKTAMFRPNTTAGYQRYQPDIKAFLHRISRFVTPWAS